MTSFFVTLHNRRWPGADLFRWVFGIYTAPAALPTLETTKPAGPRVQTTEPAPTTTSPIFPTLPAAMSEEAAQAGMHAHLHQGQEEPKPESEGSGSDSEGPEKLKGDESPEEIAKKLSAIIDSANERLKPLLAVMKEVSVRACAPGEPG